MENILKRLQPSGSLQPAWVCRHSVRSSWGRRVMTISPRPHQARAGCPQLHVVIVATFQTRKCNSRDLRPGSQTSERVFLTGLKFQQQGCTSVYERPWGFWPKPHGPQELCLTTTMPPNTHTLSLSCSLILVYPEI